MTTHYPDHVSSYENLTQHFRAQLEGLSTTAMGTKFAEFVQKLVPQTEHGAEFEEPTLNPKKSGDGGVDLIAKGKDGRSILYIQAKLWVDRADTIDNVVSKFQSFYREHHTQIAGQQSALQFDDVPIHFLLVTLSLLDGIISRYENKDFSSRAFYDECKSGHRMNFVHGMQILSLLQAAYRKTSEVPTNMVLNLETDIISKDNVYFGVLSSLEIQNLYSQFGDALFFENIRDFIGLGNERSGRTTPNQEIIKTIQVSPVKMLERNNGIVIRADAVEQGDSSRQLKVSRGSIVNGCQTTMCLAEYASEVCYVPVKIVQTKDSWDVAKAANYQNSVESIDLDLARHLRPQLAKRAGAISGIQVSDGTDSALQIIDVIYNRRVAYEETRLLYIGIFSRTPNNLFSGNYTDLLDDLIARFYATDPYGESTFETLFALQGAAHDGLKVSELKLSPALGAEKFKRFYSDKSPSYRCFISILALCGALDMDISKREVDIEAEYKRMDAFQLSPV